MSTLLLVRHGQASFGAHDYDQLSALGKEQATALGHGLADLNFRFDQVYVGPLRRHEQTHGCVADVYKARGLDWPQPTLLPEFDEHQGMQVMEHVAEHDPAVRKLLGRHATEAAANQAYLKVFQQVMRRWVGGEFDTGRESWADFKWRVAEGIEQIVHESSSGKMVIAFTSGGVIAAAVGQALGLTDQQIIELGSLVRNASYAEFLFTERRFGLSVFNATLLGGRSDLLTYV